MNERRNKNVKIKRKNTKKSNLSPPGQSRYLHKGIPKLYGVGFFFEKLMGAKLIRKFLYSTGPQNSPQFKKACHWFLF